MHSAERGIASHAYRALIIPISKGLHKRYDKIQMRTIYTLPVNNIKRLCEVHYDKKKRNVENQDPCTNTDDSSNGATMTKNTMVTIILRNKGIITSRITKLGRRNQILVICN